MKLKRYSYLAAVTLVAAFAYLAIPACGNQNNNNTPPPGGYYPPGVMCQPGQMCPAGGGVPGGIPLIPGPAFGTLDYNGSYISLQFGAPNVIAGAPYFGPVSVTGVLHLVQGTCPGIQVPPGPGIDIPVQGQAQWVSGEAGAIAGVWQANLQAAQGGAISMSHVKVVAGGNPLSFHITSISPLYFSPCGNIGYYLM